MLMKYADVVIDNNTDATDLCYTYAAAEDVCFTDDCNSCAYEQVTVGRKVCVPFGTHNRKTDGYIVAVGAEAPENVKRIKKILSVDSGICISEEAVRTAVWMRGRCLCRYIEAIKCFLPVSEVKRKTRDPFETLEIDASDSEEKNLTAEQEAALNSIKAHFEPGERKNGIFLLQGVTGSGKTEVYLQAARYVSELGKQSIILVPEIALTPQLVARFAGRFGKENIAVIHSRLTPTQRTAEYERIEKGEASLIIGARSAIFAPAANIGLIVLDEEHETSYKSDKSPKYDTIEVAAKRAMDSGAALVLGSATPSVSDYYRSEKGIFKRIELRSRYNMVSMPNVHIVDMTAEIKAGNRSLFSRALADGIEDQLKKGGQVILFLNRRGYSSYISCRECGFVVKCPECGISMPYHKDDGACICHYCGRKIKLPKICPECGSKLIGGYGAGTQQVEEKAAELFPDARIERLDLDSIKKKGELESTLKRFEKKKTDILIGTQLVAKGLDFANVGLVGIINADVTLNIPDFRSSERTFQLVTQAAGRSGRGEEVGSVIIQTYSPDSDVLLAAAAHDYKAFYDNEIKVRQAAMYPPFADIFQILVMDENKDKADDYSRMCAEWLRKNISDGAFVLGPAAPMLLKNSGMFRYQILIKSPAGYRNNICMVIRNLKERHEEYKNSAKLLTVDINPFSFT